MGGHTPAHYIRIWAILLVLLVISILGPELEIQVVTLITAFGIAFVKAYLVIKYFMHLDVEPKVVWYFLATSLAFMGLFFAAVAPDVMKHDGSNWTNLAAHAAVERGMAAGDGHGHHGDGHGDGHGDHGDGHGDHDDGHGKEEAHH